MEHTKHWQDPVSAALGAWLLLSPWMLGFVFDIVPAACMVLSGLALIAVSFGVMCTAQAWEEWVETGIGVWLVAAPWVLGFDDVTVATRSSVLCGAAVVVLALSVLLTDKHYSAWMRRRPTH